MSKILRLFTFIILSSTLSSCLLPSEKGKVSLSLSSSDQATREEGKSSRASVNEVKLNNDQIIITGSDLLGVKLAKLSQGGVDSQLSILSQSASELILSSSSKVALALNTLMSLTLEDAYGATVVEVTFNLPDSSVSTDKIGDDQVTTAKIVDGAITAVKLDQMSAAVGQLLRWNGTTWVATDLDALTYAGTWDASVGGDPNPAAVGGEYYIVSADGTADPGDGNSRSWAQGDWIVFNDNTSTWDQISNSSDVTSFEGRTGGVTAQTGDYTWAMINKTTSSIGDIADVDLSTPATTGKVLKFDGTNWIADDDLSGGGAGSVSSSEIADGSIVDADVSGSAAIAWSKINKTGAAASDVGLGNVDNIQQMPLSYLDTTITLGSDNAKVPSQNAVKTYVDNQVASSVTSITGGAGLTDGPYTTTGTIDVQVDNSTIEVNADALRLKDGGITNAKVNASAAIAWSKIDKTGATKSDVGLGNVDNIQQMPLTYLDTNTSLGTDNAKVASQNAVKTYVDAQVGAVTSSQWISSGNDISFSGGKVGIGTSSSTSTLDIQGELDRALTGTVSVSSASSAVSGTGTLFTSELDEGDIISIGGEAFTVLSIADNTNLTLSGNHVAGATSSNFFGANPLLSIKRGDAQDSLFISSKGNVGIGTSAPTEKLHLVGSSVNLVLDGNGGAGDPITTLVLRRGSQEYALRSGIGGANDFDIYDDANNQSRLYIKNGGNVGIGTTNPSTKLDVNGTITATGFSGPITSSGVSASGGSAAAPSYSFSSDSNTGFYSSSADTIEVTVGGSNIFDMSSAGLVSATTGGASVGSTNGTASAPTFSFSGDEDTGWFSPAANELSATTAGTERIRIDSSGNIAIGTASTSAHLEVNGSGDQLIEIESTDATSSSMITFKNTTDTWNAGLKLHTIYTAVDTLGFSIDDGTTSRLFIDNSGKVGLGYTKPTAGLHFASDRRANGDVLDDLTDYKINLGCSVQQSECKDSIRAAGFSTRVATADSRFTNLTYHGYAHEFFSTPEASSPSLLIDSSFYLESGDTAVTVAGHSTSASEFAFKVKDSASASLLSVTNSGLVGIGTVDPKSQLHVNGGVRVNTTNGTTPLRLLRSNSYQTEQYLDTYVDDSKAFFHYNNDEAQSYINFVMENLDTEVGGGADASTNTALTLYSDSDGPRMGVNATAPDSLFHGIGVDPVLHLQNTEPSNGSGAVIRFGHVQNSSEVPVAEIRGEVTNGSALRAGDLSFWTSTAGTLAEQMRITEEGNVGIGTVSPKEALHINGDILVQGQDIYISHDGAANTNNDYIAYDDATVIGSTGIFILKSDTARDRDYATPTAALSAKGGFFAGKVGIGTSAPNNALDIVGSLHVEGNNDSVRSTSTVNIDMAIDDNDSGINVPSDGVLTLWTNNSEKVRIISNGNMGVGETAPTYKLHVNGQVAGSAAFVNTSDERYKRNIRSISSVEESALEKVLRLNGVYFDWRSDEFPEKEFQQGRDVGVIAQNVDDVFPEAVVRDDQGYLSVAYAKLVGPLIEAVKEVYQKVLGHDDVIENQGREIDSLKEELDEVKSKNKKLEEYLCQKDPSAGFCTQN